MSVPFFYVKDPGQESLISLDEANSKHAIAVLRMQAGERIHLTDGKGSLFTAEIITPHKRNCGIRILSSVTLPRSEAGITIAISPVKNTSRFEWFLEKATELGVKTIILLVCQRTEKLHFRAERVEQILISAMLQSQQAWLPELIPPTLFDEILKRPGYQQKWIAHCLPEDRKSLRGQGPGLNDQILLIGPEGDFTKEEIQLALGAGYVAVELGSTRLRTETAGMVGAALLCIH